MGSRAGEIRLDWGGEGDRLFRLGIGEQRKIQEELDAGPTAIAARCMLSLAILDALDDGNWLLVAQLSTGKVAELVHVRTVIQHALMGAKEPDSVDRLLRDWVDGRPLIESLKACYRICIASVRGPEDEPLGEPKGEGAQPSPTESSSSPTITEPAPSSG